MEKIDVTSLEIRDYALSLKWVLVREALKDGLFVLNSPNGNYSQLVFPRDHAASDYDAMARMSLQRLAEEYGKPFPKVQEEIREVNDDVICLRYYSENKIVNYISFEEAIESIVATRQLLLSAACSVANPATFHQGMNRSEPQELIKQAKFRHTEEGSFILKVSCPFVPVAPPQPSLFDGILPNEIEKPFSRKSIELINTSSQLILESVEFATVRDLFESQSASPKPTVSYNFCEQLVKLYDEERELPFQIIFNWSKGSLLHLPAPSLPSSITFPYSHREKIEEVKAYFAPKKRDLAGFFIGTVETLDGGWDASGQRSGPVNLLVLYENEMIRAKVILDAKDYDVAWKAHRMEGAYVQFRGMLKRGTRNVLESVSEFKLSESSVSQ